MAVIQASIIRETPRAVLIQAAKTFGNQKADIWLPKSQVRLPAFQIGEEVGIEVQDWLYEKEVEQFDNNDGWQLR